VQAQRRLNPASQTRREAVDRRRACGCGCAAGVAERAFCAIWDTWASKGHGRAPQDARRHTSPSSKRYWRNQVAPLVRVAQMAWQNPSTIRSPGYAGNHHDLRPVQFSLTRARQLAGAQRTVKEISAGPPNPAQVAVRKHKPASPRYRARCNSTCRC